MNTYILRIHWDSEKKAKDLDHLRKYLVDLYRTIDTQVDVYLKTANGKRFVGAFGKYNGVPVWYTKLPTAVNNCRQINPVNGKLL